MLLLFLGAGVLGKPGPAFQGNAFQTNAFQAAPGPPPVIAGPISIWARWLGGMGTPPPQAGTPGFRSLVGRQVAGMGVTTSVTLPGFISLFGRQVGGIGLPGGAAPAPHRVVGWPDTLRRKHPRKLLERLLELQKNATFGRKWFEEFEDAERDFADAEARAAIAVAAAEAREAAELIHEQIREEEFEDALRQVALTLEVTKQVRRTKDIIAAANHAQVVARYIKAHIEFEDDEDAAIMLLLN